MKHMHDLLYQPMSARTSLLREAFFRQPDPVQLLIWWAMLGIALGTLLSCKLPESTCNFLLTQGLLITDVPRTLGDVLRSVLCPLVILLSGIWLSGFSAFGQPAALLLLLSRGTAFGIAAGACFTKYPLRDAVCICAVLLLPFGFCSIVLLCYAVRDALRLSCRMTRCLLQPAAVPLHDDTDRLSAMLSHLLLALLTAGMHTLLLWLFSRMLPE